MNDSEILHKMIYFALIEMRERGSESGDKVVYHLADLFHNVILRLQRVSMGDGTYEEVLTYVRERASKKGISQWFDDLIDGMADCERDED